MAKEVVWSTRAVASFDRVIEYLEKNWTQKEIEKFILKTQKVLRQIESGTIHFKRSEKKDLHEVLVTKHNLLIYRVRKNQIDLLVFYDTRQHPKKK